jgi:serine/threonine-protein kinase
VTGQCPFEGSSLFAVLAAIVGGTLIPPKRLVPALDETFDAIVTRALSKDPAQRFPDLRALGAALLTLASPRVQLGYASEFLPVPAAGVLVGERRAEPARLSDHGITVVAPYQDAVSSALESACEMPVSLDLLAVGSGRRSMSVAHVLIGSTLVLAALASVALAGSDEAAHKAPARPIHQVTRPQLPPS